MTSLIIKSDEWSWFIDSRVAVLRAETVREVLIQQQLRWEGWHSSTHIPWDDIDDRHKRERTVPVSLPDLTMPCPECGGCGAVGSYRNAITRGIPLVTCPTCAGSGRVPRPVLVGTEQWRLTTDGSDWSGPYNAEGTQSWEWLEDRGKAERRLALLDTTTVEAVLPVVDEHTANVSSPFLTLTSGRVWLYTDNPADDGEQADGARWTDLTDEPWAQSLKPGDTVLRFGPSTPLDEPVVDLDLPYGKLIGENNG